MRVAGYQIRRWISLSLVLLALPLFGGPLAVSQLDPCDPYLLQPKENPLGYRLRGEQGDRCEGQYIEQVASTALSVASLTKTFEKYNLNSDRPLHIQWPKLGEQDIRLRAHGIKWKLYYRMDTVRSAGTTTFQWPIGILSALHIQKNSVGIVGWTYEKVGDTTQKIYLPLRVTQSEKLPSKEAYRLVLWPGVQLKEVYISLAKIDDAGRPQEFLQEGKPLEYGFYPAQRAIPVSLSGVQTSGIYKVTISATLESGGATTKEFWFYHQGF